MHDDQLGIAFGIRQPTLAHKLDGWKNKVEKMKRRGKGKYNVTRSRQRTPAQSPGLRVLYRWFIRKARDTDARCISHSGLTLHDTLTHMKHPKELGEPSELVI